MTNKLLLKHLHDLGLVFTACFNPLTNCICLIQGKLEENLSSSCIFIFYTAFLFPWKYSLLLYKHRRLIMKNLEFYQHFTAAENSGSLYSMMATSRHSFFILDQ